MIDAAQIHQVERVLDIQKRRTLQTHSTHWLSCLKVAANLLGLRGTTVSAPHPTGNPPHVHQPLTQTVVDELNDIGTCPSTGESAARTTWVMDQILAGYRKQTEQD